MSAVDGIKSVPTVCLFVCLSVSELCHGWPFRPFYRPRSWEIMYLVVSVCLSVTAQQRAKKRTPCATRVKVFVWVSSNRADAVDRLLIDHCRRSFGQEYWQTVKRGDSMGGCVNAQVFSIYFVMTWSSCDFRTFPSTHLKWFALDVCEIPRNILIPVTLVSGMGFC